MQLPHPVRAGCQSLRVACELSNSSMSGFAANRGMTVDANVTAHLGGWQRAQA